MFKILVIDDDFSNAKVIQMVLESEGFQVECICCSALLGRSVSRFCPDLVLMDILLDNNDGRSLCNELKMGKRTGHIPVLLITAMLESQVGSIACNADAVMFKPFEYMVLVNNVRMVLQRNAKRLAPTG